MFAYGKSTEGLSFTELNPSRVAFACGKAIENIDALREEQVRCIVAEYRDRAAKGVFGLFRKDLTMEESKAAAMDCDYGRYGIASAEAMHDAERYALKAIKSISEAACKDGHETTIKVTAKDFALFGKWYSSGESEK